MEIQCGLSWAFLNKDNLTDSDAAYGNSFKPKQVTPTVIAEHQLAGRAIVAAHFEGNTRRNDTFISQQVFTFDYDDGVSVADVLANAFVQQYAFLVFPTASSGKVTDKNPTGAHRTRVAVATSEPVYGLERARTVSRAIAEHIGLEIDESSYKPAQPSYGSTNRVEQPYINLEAVLPLALAGALTVDQARADYAHERHLLELRSRPTVSLTGTRAEAYAAKTLQNALNKLAATTANRNDAILDTALGLFCKATSGDWPGIDDSTVQSGLEGVVSAWPNVRKSLGTINRARQYAASKPEPLVLPADDDYEPAPAPSVASTPKDTGFQWGQAALPSSWRTAMLKYHPHLAPVADLVNQAARRGLIDVNNVTVAALCAASLAMNAQFAESTVYNMVKDGTAKEFFQECPTCSLGEAEDKTRKTPGGRPTTRYRIIAPDQLCAYLEACAAPRIYERNNPVEPTHYGPAVLARATAGMLRDFGYSDDATAKASALNQVLAPAFEAQDNAQERAMYRAKKQRRRLSTDLNDLSSVELPDGWPIGNLALYRAAYCKALYTENPHLTRKEFAQALGVDIRRVNAILERAGLESVKQPLVEQVISTTGQDAAARIKTLGYELRGYPLKVESRMNGRAVRSTLYDPETIGAFVQNAHAYGAEIVAYYQVANVQEVVRDTPPERPQREAPPRKPVEQQSEEAAEMEAEVTEKAYYGPHYSPAWLKAWCKLAMVRLGWQQPNGWIVTPDGAIVADDASADELVAILMDFAKPPNVPTLEADGIGYLMHVTSEFGGTLRKREAVR